MKRTWITLSLAALMTLSLMGCAGNRTGDYMETASPRPSHSPTVAPATQTPSHLPERNAGDKDLAGSDGVVGGNGVNDGPVGGSGAGNTGNENANGRADNSALEDMERGVRDTLDDLGSAARRMGEDARRAIEG